MLKQDPALIAPGFYQELTNFRSPLEGNITVRGGTQQLAVFAGAGGSVHSIARLIANNSGSSNYTVRYVGYGSLLQRSPGVITPGSPSTLTFSTIATGIANAGDLLQNQRFQTADAAINSSSYTYKLFACQKAMLKDNGSLGTAELWGIFPPVYPAQSSNTSIGSGPVVFTGAEVPYTYVYTYENSNTLSEGNPSVYQVANPVGPPVGITPNGFEIQVTVHGTSDPQIGVSGISIYRAGGSFADGFYRFIGQIDNPGSSFVNFFDTLQDSQIAANKLLETDNDPPVPMGLPVPWVGTATSVISGGIGAGALVRYHIGSFTGPAGYGPTAGDLVIIGPNTENEEIAYIEATDGSTYIEVWQQLAHVDTLSGFFLKFEVDTQTGAACDIVLAAYDAVFLAGALFTPHVLYKSKPGLVESWGVFYNDGGYSDAINVSNPGDPIHGLFEFGGGVAVITLEGVYWVGVFNGQMQIPQRTPAQHGSVSKAACCRAQNDIWYSSYDGIYTYSGGIEIWMSEEIDPLFHGIAVGSYPPISMVQGVIGRGVDAMTLAFNGTEILFTYTSSDTQAYTLVYDKKLKRWNIDTFAPVSNSLPLVVAQNVEFDNGYRLLTKSLNVTNDEALLLADSGTADNWTSSPAVGDSIPFAASMQTIDWSPAVDKLFSDFLLECEDNQNSISISTFYNFSTTPDPTDAYTITPANLGRNRYPFSFHDSDGFEAYAASLRCYGTTSTECTLYSLTLSYYDEVSFTKGLAIPYGDLGYPADKTFRAVTLEIDTGGIAATVTMLLDGNSIELETITTTYAARMVILSIPTNTTGRMATLQITPGPGGKTNLFAAPQWDYAKEPLAVNYWTSLTISAGYNGYQFWKQIWLQYYSTAAIVVNIYSEDSLLWSVTLPTHGDRLEERFYLPAENGGVFNKAKTHRIEISCTGIFRQYAESSRIEWLAIGSDQRAGYQQDTIQQMMQPKP